MLKLLSVCVFEQSWYMTINNLLNIKSRDELREWLMQNHDKETECWVVVKRGRPVDDGTFWYVDAVEEAMCFGWIDSTTKKLADGVTAQRLCPRKPRSNWSELKRKGAAGWKGSG